MVSRLPSRTSTAFAQSVVSTGAPLTYESVISTGARSAQWRDPRISPCSTSSLEPRTSNLGFTLFELLIVMMIIAILAAMAVPMYTRNVVAAKEAVLKEDLQIMRTAIGSYTVDKQKAPQALDDLVTAGYLKAIPKDPFTGRTDTWITAQSDTLSSVDQTDPGIDDVHSGAQMTGNDGTSYNTW
jgi:general secretion pathway protein G